MGCDQLWPSVTVVSQRMLVLLVLLITISCITYYGIKTYGVVGAVAPPPGLASSRLKIGHYNRSQNSKFVIILSTPSGFNFIISSIYTRMNTVNLLKYFFKKFFKIFKASRILIQQQLHFCKKQKFKRNYDLCTTHNFVLEYNSIKKLNLKIKDNNDWANRYFF